MGSPGQESSIAAADYHHTLSFSPGSVHDALFPPASLHDGLPQRPGLLKLASCFDGSTALPAPVETRPATTPLITDDISHPNTMNLLVGGALAPMHTTSPPHQKPSRPDPGLRLPSFEALGIAAPHPDRFGAGLSLDSSASSAIMDSSEGEPASESRRSESDLLSAFTAAHISPALVKPHLNPEALIGGRHAIRTPLGHDLATLTPPAETGDTRYNLVAAVPNAAMESPSTESTSFAANEPQQGVEPTSPTPVEGAESSAPQSWIDGALHVLLNSLRTANNPGNPLRVLSHALPSPSANGHVYPDIVQAIHGSTPSQPTVWINVFHAIQGRFNLADLPTSPPSTPGPPVGGDDYFTQKVFDTAVPISDYQEDLSSLPRSPRPVVPPSSINVSVVERYIPPTSSNEFRDMFNPNGPSILVDRLVELSPNNGSLIFVYPTRAGAETFTRDYLGPVIDPLLRTIHVVHGLSSELGKTLGTMAAVQALPDHDQLQRSITALCAKLTQRSSSMERFHGHRASFSLMHASKEEVQIQQETLLKDWWAKQEKPRVRDAMTRFAQEAQKRKSNENVDRAITPTELIGQLLDGVTKRQYPSVVGGKRGIEVSVFVIQRSD